jgi:hypothetical protein
MCQSCNIATSIHFNKDYSGTYSSLIDLSDLLSMASMFDTTGTMDQNTMITQMRDSIGSLNLEGMYNNLSGIKDANVEVSDEGAILVAFKFDNLESLTASFKSLENTAGQMSSGEGSMDMNPADFLGGDHMFKREGKTLSYSLSSEGGMGEGMMGEGGDMDMITSMIDYTVNLSFDRKVKSVDVEGLTIVEKGTNEVKTRVDFAKFLKDGSYSIKVKTK